MKKYSILLLSVLFLGCTSVKTVQPNGSETPIPPLKNPVKLNLSDSERQVIEPQEAGAQCDNETSFCGAGLECQFGDSVDMGTCQAKALKDIKCSSEKKPVCAVKNNQKLGYLNECEAERHGAEFVNEGLCKQELTTSNNCKAPVRAIGNCNSVLEGFAFNAVSESCESVSVRGCSVETPFKTMDGCSAVCLGLSEVEDGKIRTCPDIQINDQMPLVINDGESLDDAKINRSYFIYQGRRVAMKDFDMDWVNENCEVPSQTVY